MASSNKNIILNNETLLTRKDVCEESNIELSYLDSLDTYYDLKHIKKIVTSITTELNWYKAAFKVFWDR